MHVDVNSAYLSWSAAELPSAGTASDLRRIPAVVGGDEAARHGIVLARSIPAKGFGIRTGETLMEARRKCPNLKVIPTDFELYSRRSDDMFALLSEYSDVIQRFSVDECFVDYTGSEKRFGEPVKTANEIRERFKEELGFTVNIGVSVNKILAKMASELEKPDKVHTLFPEEVPEKMWPLPVRELFMVGRASAKKLNSINIKTIGDLAHADPGLIKSMFGKHGELMRNYANGIDYSRVIPEDKVEQKGIGNSLTIDHDVKTKEEACRYILSLSEKVARRLRGIGAEASVVSVTVRTSDFMDYQHQRSLAHSTDLTDEIYELACELFEECWGGEPIRLLGVSVGRFDRSGEEQLSIFERPLRETESLADKVVDEIRGRFGTDAIVRGSLIEGPEKGS